MKDIQYLNLQPSDEAILHSAYERICADAACMERFARARALFFEKGTDFAAEVEAVAEAVDVHQFTVGLVFLLTCTEQMHQLYKAHGYSEALYRDALADVGVKAEECKRVYGVVGIFVLFWYPAMFTCRRFILGRLEYEELAFPLESYRDILKKGDPVLNCHIPSSGALPQEVGPEVNFWRVFYRPWTEDALENAPEDTSLQRALKQYLKSGKKWAQPRGSSCLTEKGSSIGKEIAQGRK